ncbi:MAG: lysostaphin resistance A-like protein, partial [Baekduiaceae bacterium]
MTLPRQARPHARPMDYGGRLMPTTQTSSPVTFQRGLLVFAVYAVVSAAIQLFSGVDYDEISASVSNILTFVVLSVGAGIVGVLILTARWGANDAVFRERPRLDRPAWLWVVPLLFVVVIVGNLAGADWGEWDAAAVLVLLLGCLMIGFGEEIVFRGYVLVGARSRFSETGAWFASSLLFGLFHGTNILTGQAVGITLRQVGLAFLLGGALYFVRRVSGYLVVGMLLHGLWDFSTFIAAGPGDSHVVDDISGSAALVSLALPLLV